MQHINAPGNPPTPQRLQLDPSLFYDPPYERPLEDTFVWHLAKYLNPVDELLYQVRAVTPCAPCWIDFVVELNGHRVGFEISDLEDETDARQDQLRDALVVGSGAVDALYRVRGETLLDHVHDVLYLIARWEPELFSHRGHVNLRTLASAEVQDVLPATDADRLHLTLSDGMELHIGRCHRAVPATWVRRYDEALAIFAPVPTARRA